MGITATYLMPGFTTRKDARDMCEPCGLRLKSFTPRDDGGVVAVFTADTLDQVATFSADLSYQPESINQ